MKAVVCYYWNEDLKRPYLPEYVNSLQRAFARCLPEKHRFVCVADTAKGLSKDVEFLELPKEVKWLTQLKGPEGSRFPTCYRRLWTFSEQFGKLFDPNEWILTTDVDAIPIKEISALFAFKGEFIGWRPSRDWGRPVRFGGGSYLLKPGKRTQVFTDFKGEVSIREARLAGFRGSDQAWISYKLSATEPCWPQHCGIYSVRDMGPGLFLPEAARLVHFNGHLKPWHFAQRAHGPGSWVSQYWR